MTPWVRCSECRAPGLTDDGMDVSFEVSYLFRVVADEGQLFEVFLCPGCFEQTIEEAFFTPVEDGEEDLWNL